MELEYICFLPSDKFLAALFGDESEKRFGLWFYWLQMCIKVLEARYSQVGVFHWDNASVKMTYELSFLCSVTLAVRALYALWMANGDLFGLVEA